jgi:molybdopterin converting factor subunit 1
LPIVNKPASLVMTVRVLYFAVVRERLKRSDESVDLREGATVDDLLDELERRYPALASLRGACKIAVNQDFAAGDRALRDGDEVALIPPVAGG